MRHLRYALSLALICCLATPIGVDRALAGRASTPAVGQIGRLIEPMVRQVVQRRDDNVGRIFVVGTYSGNVDGFQAMSTLRPGMSGTPVGWSPLSNVSASGGVFTGIFRQPAGGFYDIQVRPTYRGRAGSAQTVLAVGVGEVFITAGQSNSTNSGQATGFVPDLRVSAFVDGPGHGFDTSYPGARWQWGTDPQPALDQTGGGSVWPTMASNLANALDMPIGLYSAGYGGTSIEQWLPGAEFDSPNLGDIVLFQRLANAIGYFAMRGGARAVLWDQGESDVYDNTPPATYRANLASLIFQSRSQTGVPIKWVVARATGPLGVKPALQAGIEAAQLAVVDNLSVFAGPNTDAIGLDYRLTPYQDVHFNAAGLQLLGGWWGMTVFDQPNVLKGGLLPPY